LYVTQTGELADGNREVPLPGLEIGGGCGAVNSHQHAGWHEILRLTSAGHALRQVGLILEDDPMDAEPPRIEPHEGIVLKEAP
jgi:hypothetical protein